MSFHTFIFVICFLLLERGRCLLAQRCSNQSQQLCLSYMSGDGIDIQTIDEDLPPWNETAEQLQQRCLAFDSFSTCIASELNECSSKKQAAYSGWIDAYEYLCNKQSNLTEVAGYLQCYGAVAQSPKYICLSMYKGKYNNLLNGSSSISEDMMSDFCKLADSFFTCVNKTVANDCGEKAARWQWSWDRKLNTPLLKSCPGWTSDESTDQGGTSAWAIALIIVLVLITLIMVLASGFFLVFLCRKRKERTRIQEVRRRSHTVGPPPPYAAVMYTASEPDAEPQAHLVDSSVAVRPNELGSSTGEVHPPTDVMLPPPYMGEQPPVPAYEPPGAKTVRGDEEEECTKKESCQTPAQDHETLHKETKQDDKDGCSQSEDTLQPRSDLSSAQ